MKYLTIIKFIHILHNVSRMSAPGPKGLFICISCKDVWSSSRRGPLNVLPRRKILARYLPESRTMPGGTLGIAQSVMRRYCQYRVCIPSVTPGMPKMEFEQCNWRAQWKINTQFVLSKLRITWVEMVLSSMALVHFHHLFREVVHTIDESQRR